MRRTANYGILVLAATLFAIPELPADEPELFNSAFENAPQNEPSPTTRNADYDSYQDTGAIEQIQFGGFGSRFFGRSPFATATAQSNAAGAANQPEIRRLAARAPMTERRQRLARAPDMLGDTLQAPLLLILDPQFPMNNGLTANVPLSVAGGSARTKIGEHNKPLPTDRWYLNYNHFHNAVQRQVFNGFGEQVTQTAHLDRFTMGTERTLLNGDASVELRLPLSAFPDLDTTLPTSGPEGHFKSFTGSVGNLSMIGKRLLVSAEDLTVSCGMGIEFPTGADSSVLTGTTRFNVENESLLLQPFAAATLDNGEVFFHSFLQVDVDVTGSPLTVSDPLIPGPPLGIGEINGRTLLHWDTAAGLWFARSEADTGLTGVAGIVEYHLTTATSSTDHLAGVVPTSSGPLNFLLSAPPGTTSFSYITTGIHTEFAQSRTVRVAAVFPLEDGLAKMFDAEFVVQFGGRY